MLSTFMLGSKIPISFNLKNRVSSISFATMPSDVYLRIQGLSVCFVFAFSNPSDALIAPSLVGDSWGLHIIISNETKYLKWSYCPDVQSIVRVDEDLLWLSYWKFEDHRLEGGDVLNILVPTTEVFQVKEIGVRVVYRKEAKEDKSSQQGRIQGKTPRHHSVRHLFLLPELAAQTPSISTLPVLSTPRSPLPVCSLDPPLAAKLPVQITPGQSIPFMERQFLVAAMRIPRSVSTIPCLQILQAPESLLLALVLWIAQVVQTIIWSLCGLDRLKHLEAVSCLWWIGFYILLISWSFISKRNQHYCKFCLCAALL